MKRIYPPIYVLSKWVMVLLLSYVGSSSAQEYAFRNYSIGQGLSESVVNTLTQDEKGYIWMGTGFGLNRFDGHDFTIYLQENGLKSTQINTLYKGADNKIWIGTAQGLHWYSPIKDSIYHVSEVPANSIISVFEDSHNQLWLGTEEQGIYLYSPKHPRSSLHLNPSTLTFNGPVRKIVELDSSYLLVSRSGIYELEAYNHSDSTTFNITPISQETRYRDAVLDTVNNLVWIGSREGLYRYKDGQIELQGGIDSGIAARIQTLALDQDGTLWMGTEDGLLHQREDALIKYGTEEGLSNTLINNLFFDKEGILWIGTYGGGANVFLGEYVGIWRWTALLVGLLGVLIIVKPGSAAFQWAVILPLLSAIAYATLHTITRSMGLAESPITMSLYIQLVFIVVCLGMGLMFGDGRFAGLGHPSAEFILRAWAWPSGRDVLLFVAAGFFSASGGYLISQAYRSSSAGLVAPFEYSTVILAVLWGYIFWQEVPGLSSAFGIFLIIASGVFVAIREFKRQVPPASQKLSARR